MGWPMRSPRSLLLAPASLLAALALVSSASAEPIAGTYAGKGPGVKASLEVAPSGGARLSFTIRTSCGKAKDSLKLSAAPGDSLKGKSSSAHRSVKAAVEQSEGVLSGSIKYRADGGEGEKPCKAKRAFSAELDASSSPEVKSTVGHYSGVGEDGGLPIAFDVTYGDDGFEIAGMSFDTSTDCYDE